MNQIEASLILLGFSILSFGAHFLILQPRVIPVVNPTLWIESDEVKIQVWHNKRVVLRRNEFRAVKNTERYRFKFKWSGFYGIKISLMSSDDTLLGIRSPMTRLSWIRYEVRFKETLRAGDRKTVILRYDLSDPKSTSKPYHLISYKHVLGCRRLTFRLAFPENGAPRKVYLIHYDSDEVVQKGLPVPFDDDTNEYHCEVAPEPGIKYSIEWQEI